MEIFGYELDDTVLIISVVFWLVVLLSVWVVPAKMNIAAFPLTTGILISVVMLPGSYVIVSMINNK